MNDQEICGLSAIVCIERGIPMMQNVLDLLRRGGPESVAIAYMDLEQLCTIVSRATLDTRDHYRAMKAKAEAKPAEPPPVVSLGQGDYKRDIGADENGKLVDLAH